MNKLELSNDKNQHNDKLSRIYFYIVLLMHIVVLVFTYDNLETVNFMHKLLMCLIVTFICTYPILYIVLFMIKRIINKDFMPF